MMRLSKLQIKTLQQHSPDDLHLLVCEGQSDAAMPAATEADQAVCTLSIFFPAGTKPVGIVHFRFAEDLRQAMGHRRRHHRQAARGNDVFPIAKVAKNFSHEHDQRWPQSFRFFDGTLQCAQSSNRIQCHFGAARPAIKNLFLFLEDARQVLRMLQQQDSRPCRENSACVLSGKDHGQQQSGQG